MELKVSGRRVNAATGGRPFEPARPAIVFLHGAGMDRTNWQLPARALAWRGFSVLAVDLPGHGSSQGPPLRTIADMAKWVPTLLDAVGLARAAVVGHSMGGAIALETAATFPDRITRIGLLGTAAAIPVSEKLLQAARETPEVAYQMMTAWAHSAAAKIGGHPVPGLWMTGGSLALFARNEPGVLHADLAACNAWSSGRAAAGRVRCPALVMMAANDVMTPAKEGAELGRLISGSRTVSIENCGHMLMAERPDAVLDALIDFCAPAEAA